MDDRIDGDKIASFIAHPAWGLLDQWINAQGSSERLLGLDDWEEYRRIQGEIQFARSFRDQIDTYLHNRELAK